MKSGFLGRNAVKIGLSLVVTIGMFAYLRGQGMSFKPPPSEAIWGIPHLWTYPAFLVVSTIATALRAARWRLQLRSFADVPLIRVLTVSWVSFAAIFILPFRLGEVVRPMMIRDRGRVSATAAAGTVVTERVLDGLVLSFILGIALWYAPPADQTPEFVVGLKDFPTSRVRGFGATMFTIFVGAFAVIGVFYKFRTWAHAMTLTVFGVVSMSLAEKLAGIAEKLADGMAFLARPKDAVPYLLETSLYWGLNAASMWLLAWGCGLTHADGSGATYMDALALIGVLGAAMLIPAPPGMLGVFQAGLYCAMTLFFDPKIILGPGAVYVFMLYVMQVGLALVSAGISLLDPGTRRALFAADVENLGESMMPAASAVDYRP